MSFTLLNTRPAHQAKVLNELVLAAGGAVLNCPTLDINWLPEAADQAELPSAFDKVIFISANAVSGLKKQHDLPKIERWLSAGKNYAIGQATLQKGQQLGLQIEVLSEQQFDSEHFLAHQSMQAVEGQKILLVKGKNGRKMLQQTLTARGAEVYPLDVYQRRPAVFCEEVWKTFLQASNPILLVTSVESWQSLLQGVTATSQFQTLALISRAVVMSQRIAEQMIADGWQQPIEVVATQGNQGIIEAIMASDS